MKDDVLKKYVKKCDHFSLNHIVFEFKQISSSTKNILLINQIIKIYVFLHFFFHVNLLFITLYLFNYM